MILPSAAAIDQSGSDGISKLESVNGDDGQIIKKRWDNLLSVQIGLTDNPLLYALAFLPGKATIAQPVFVTARMFSQL